MEEAVRGDRTGSDIGALSTRSRRTRIGDVAREAGVSKTAVSFAFNSPSRLNSDTATRILEVAEALGYRPDPIARMLSEGRTKSVGVLTPRLLEDVFGNPFFAEFTVGVGRAAQASGLGVQFVSPLHGSLASAVRQATVDGVIAVGLSADHPEMEEVRQGGLPIVFVDSGDQHEVPGVEIDDELAAHQAAAHLVALGHREFVVIGFEPPLPADNPLPDHLFSVRLRGYRAGLAEGGVELPDTNVVVGPVDPDGGFAAFERAWEDGLRPSAALVMSDAMAFGVLAAARRLGLRVPEELSIVGFDGLAMTKFTDPPLTTVGQPIARKGEEAVRILLQLLDGQSPDRPVHRRLETALIIRGSTGPVPPERQEVRPD